MGSITGRQWLIVNDADRLGLVRHVGGAALRCAERARRKLRSR
jgi:hypothetical protein